MIEIPLRRRDGSIRAFALVDDADARFNLVRWYLGSNGYVCRSMHTPHDHKLALAREILGLGPKREDPREADHIDGDPLNNRRSNLRIVTRTQQGHNVPARGGKYSAHRGVRYDKAWDRWFGSVRVENHMHVTKRFRTEEEARVAVVALRATLMTHVNEDRSVAR